MLPGFGFVLVVGLHIGHATHDPAACHGGVELITRRKIGRIANNIALCSAGDRPPTRKGAGRVQQPSRIFHGLNPALGLLQPARNLTSETGDRGVESIVGRVEPVLGGEISASSR